MPKTCNNCWAFDCYTQSEKVEVLCDPAKVARKPLLHHAPCPHPGWYEDIKTTYSALRAAMNRITKPSGAENRRKQKERQQQA